MAKKTETITTLTDDLDGSKADRTVNFAFDGVAYEIELSRKNASAFEKALKPYVDAGRRVRGTGSRGRGPARGRSRNDLTAVREWAVAAGLPVSERGRIAQSVHEAYDAAH